jgi:hypothetical protein
MIRFKPNQSEINKLLRGRGQEVDNFIFKYAKDTSDGASKNAESYSNLTNVETGDLARNYRLESPKPAEWHVVNQVKGEGRRMSYAGIQEFGSSAHDIAARNAPMLKFLHVRYQKVVRALVVTHPGTQNPPKPLTRAFLAASRKFLR